MTDVVIIQIEKIQKIPSFLPTKAKTMINTSCEKYQRSSADDRQQWMSLPYIRGSSSSSYSNNSNNRGPTSGSSSMVRNSAGYRDRAEENSMTLMEMENNQKWVSINLFTCRNKLLGLLLLGCIGRTGSCSKSN